ncbi:hypothetical protein LCGC14_0267960 [marine sediment metagenome]|uniref:Uncharacterized protein n=1 Tax=marine sediment metagenome TaxID=412755 RepID=A0A0F9U060_9ZZZZ
MLAMEEPTEYLECEQCERDVCDDVKVVTVHHQPGSDEDCSLCCLCRAQRPYCNECKAVYSKERLDRLLP